MAITYVSTANATSGDNTSVSPPLPTGWQAGDAHFLFASVRNSGTGTVDDLTGWTTLVTFGNTKLMGRIAQAADAAPTVTFTGGAAGDTTLAQIVGLRGATLAVTSATQLNASAQDINYPGLTVSTAGSAVLLLGWKQDDSGSISTPAGFSAANSLISTTGNDALQTIRYQIQTAATNVTSGTLTVTGGAAAISRAIVVAIAPPTLTATAVAAGDPPRVDLSLSWAGAEEITVQRVDPDGRTRPVRNAEPADLTSGAWAGSDYESWFGESTVYQATSGSATIDAAAVSLDVDTVWLRHPGTPTLSQQIRFEGWSDLVRPVTQAVLEPLGRLYPIVVTDGKRKSPRTTMTVRALTLTELDEVLALFADAAVLLLDVPPGKGYGITHHYIAAGDLTEARLNPGIYASESRTLTMPVIVVDRPAGGDQAVRTWATVLTEATTWTELVGLYDTWTDVLSGDTS